MSFRPSFKSWIVVCWIACTMVVGMATIAPAQETSGGYTIGLGDVLEINVWKDEELSTTASVRPDGMITVPLVGDVRAVGRTPGTVQKELAAKLERYVTAPAVSVIVEEINSRKVYVTGNVESPGEYDLIQPLRLMQVIAMAGGLSEFAKKDGIVVLREGASGLERFEVSVKAITGGSSVESNVALRPGDTIYVP